MSKQWLEERSYKPRSLVDGTASQLPRSAIITILSFSKAVSSPWSHRILSSIANQLFSRLSIESSKVSSMAIKLI